MNIPSIPQKKPAILKGLLWSLFAGSATLGAFVLPAFILDSLTTSINFEEKSWIVPLVSLILIASTYFGLYRFAVFTKDIGLTKTALILKILFVIIFSLSLIVLLFLNFLI